MPFFSVIIPLFNRAALIRSTLLSLVTQEFRDFEVIVVDDASTDDGPGIVRREFSAVRLFSQPNGGPGAARNTGIQKATGEYLAFLDSDDHYLPWTLSTYRAAIAACPDAHAIMGNLVPFRDDAEIADIPQAAPRFEPFPDFYTACHRQMFWAFTTLCYRRSSLLQVGGFDEFPMNTEDLDLILHLGDVPFVHIAAPHTLAYRQHPGSYIQNMDRGADGIRHIVSEEKAGLFPGGLARRHERRAIITYHLRGVAQRCLENRAPLLGWDLYARGIPWHLRQLRLRFLALFPALSLFCVLKSLTSRPPPTPPAAR